MSLQSSPPHESESPSFLGALSFSDAEDMERSFFEWYDRIPQAVLEADRLAWRLGGRTWSLWVLSWLRVLS